jgi:hypothetical protein
MFQFATSSHPDTELILFNLFLFKIIQRMRTASIGPHIWESDLLSGALLKEQFPIFWTEDECAKCTMEQTLSDIFHKMAYKGRGLVSIAIILNILMAYMSFCRVRQSQRRSRRLRYISHPSISIVPDHIPTNQCWPVCLDEQ